MPFCVALDLSVSLFIFLCSGFSVCSVFKLGVC
jgi:hypothetical protein